MIVMKKKTARKSKPTLFSCVNTHPLFTVLFVLIVFLAALFLAVILYIHRNGAEEATEDTNIQPAIIQTMPGIAQ